MTTENDATLHLYQEDCLTQLRRALQHSTSSSSSTSSTNEIDELERTRAYSAMVLSRIGNATTRSSDSSSSSSSSESSSSEEESEEEEEEDSEREEKETVRNGGERDDVTDVVAAKSAVITGQEVALDVQEKAATPASSASMAETSASKPPPLQQQHYSKNPKATKKNKKRGVTNKSKAEESRDDLIRKMGTPPCTVLSLPPSSSSSDTTTTTMTKNVARMGLAVPTALLSQDLASTASAAAAAAAAGGEEESLSSVCQYYVSLAEALGPEEGKTVVVLLLRSGRFAGGVFRGSKCLVHRASQRYTVRRGQGTSQSALDSSSGKAKSIGAQLRRAGESQLQSDVTATLLEWTKHIHDAAIILISCPKAMRKNFHEGNDVEKILLKNDERIRRVPLDVGRPSFGSVCAVHELMMRCIVQPMGTMGEKNDHSVEEGNGASLEPVKEDKEEDDDQKQQRDTFPKKKRDVVPLTPLHEAAAAADLSAIQQILGNIHNDDEDDDDENNDHTTTPAIIDTRAGPSEMTPLHYAASSTSPNAPTCITTLLIHYHANPCIVDSRNRVPYYLASTNNNDNTKIRDAFRKARATLGEEYWDWDDGAKVGPPLTNESALKKKEKAAEKKRRQRARQKEKKAKERAIALEEERHRIEEKERRVKEEEEAKRIRDGLMKPKPKQQGKQKGQQHVCDFCFLTVCKKKSSSMFTRLEYSYCSMDCVRDHQRELMAAAASARLSGGGGGG